MQKKRDLERLEESEMADEGRPSAEKLLQNIENVRERREFLLLMSPLIPGYAMKLNRWRE
jgi:hypothetical protein